jgi:hypothetical protein
VTQKSQQLDPYNLHCEARLALGELEMELNTLRPRARRQAEQVITRPNVVVVANKLAL